MLSIPSPKRAISSNPRLIQLAFLRLYSPFKLIGIWKGESGGVVDSRFQRFLGVSMRRFGFASLSPWSFGFQGVESSGSSLERGPTPDRGHAYPEYPAWLPALRPSWRLRSQPGPRMPPERVRMPQERRKVESRPRIRPALSMPQSPRGCSGLKNRPPQPLGPPPDPIWGQPSSARPGPGLRPRGVAPRNRGQKPADSAGRAELHAVRYAVVVRDGPH